MNKIDELYKKVNDLQADCDDHSQCHDQLYKCIYGAVYQAVKKALSE